MITCLAKGVLGMLSAYVKVLLCVIELLAFVAFKNTTASELKAVYLVRDNKCYFLFAVVVLFKETLRYVSVIVLT